MGMLQAAALGGLLILGTAVSGTTSAAAGPAAADEPLGSLTLSLTVGASSDPVTVELTCEPDGGTHPDPAAACDVMRKASGDLRTLRIPQDTLCFALFDPHTVQATGQWNGRKVAYEKTFGNKCELRAAHGTLFDF